MIKKKPAKAKPGARSAATRSSPDVKPYGDPIRQVIAQGDPAAMRSMSVSARRWITDTEKQLADAKKALEKLDALLPRR